MTIRALRVGRALAAATFSEFAQYRAEMLIWMLYGLQPLIMMFVWMGLAGEGEAGGYSAGDFALYFLFAFLVRQMTPVWVMGVLDREIRLGELSPRLLRPLDPYWTFAMQHLVALSMRAQITVPIIVLGLYAAGVLGEVPVGRIPLFVLALACAWLMYFNLMYAMGMLAFWSEQAIALEMLIWNLYLVLGGIIAPLDLFPTLLREVALWTPFPYILDFPVSVVLGKIGGAEMLRGFLVQLGWIALFVTAHRLMWRRGLARYAATGA